VGFRPYVFNLAQSLHLKGYVSNTAEGVFIDIEGSEVQEFIKRLRREAPPLSRITDLVVKKFPLHGYSGFAIRHSLNESGNSPFTLVSPDVSICDECLQEMLDPLNRRYLYPFINCTNCGPRYSITRAIPYDRPNTTMSDFNLCPECRKEYEDPGSRRFHAQPNACPECGPGVGLRVPNAECGMRNREAINEAIRMLQQGQIIAVKGLGGFHIACDASHDAAVRRLREKKRRSNKPFAVMAPTIGAAEQFCMIANDEKTMLLSNRRPVVLMAKRQRNGLSEAVSPNNQYLGVMLPYTPLHYLLFYQPLDGQIPAKPHFEALVMTSGNISEEPIVRDNSEAVDKLSHIVDGFLLHNRGIFMRVDDTVMRVRSERISETAAHNSELIYFRRSRGYAPEAIELHNEGPEVLGCGADLKNTFTLTKGKYAIPSQHIGDMENYETVKFFEESLQNIKTVYRADPKVIVHDLHPEYLSTKWAIECGARQSLTRSLSPKGEGQADKDNSIAERGMKTFGIQHHYAHIGSVMAEHGLRDKVIGVAFDGTGYGTDGNLWGGEFLIADIEGFERVGQFQYIPLPGGEVSIREPWRTAVSFVVQAAGGKAPDFLGKIGFIERYGKDTVDKIMMIARSRELSPLSSSAGRLFDAVAALTDICDKNTFEGEAAMALESFAGEGIEDQYPVELHVENGYTVISFAACIRGLIDDIVHSVDREIMAAKFHNTVASTITRTVFDLCKTYGIGNAALSGGTFQNLYLLNRTTKALRASGMNVFLNSKVPCNDGGISLGQAYLVRERLRKRGVESSR
jgi:hydrogenase maturation protein HypF